MKTADVRKKLYMTQAEFARFLGVDVRTVQNWDARESFPEWGAMLIDTFVIPFKESVREWYSVPSEDRDKLPFYELEVSEPEHYEETEFCLGWHMNIERGYVMSADIACFRYYPYVREGGHFVLAPFGVQQEKVPAMLKRGDMIFR